MTIIDDVLGYAARGWRVVPVRPRTKHPCVDAWQDAATTGPDLIRSWWERWPDHGVGIVTGARTKLWVLDVDVATGKAGDDTLADLEAEHGTLPDTVEDQTGSGGRHLLFAWPTDGRVIRNDAGRRLGPGLDVRGEGGQVIAPPSVHPNGTAYAWEVEHGPDDVPVVQAPEWLLTLVCDNPAPVEAERRPAAPTDPDAPGAQWAATVTWPDLIEADGAVCIGTRIDRHSGEPYELWSRPPMPAEEDFKLHTSATLYYRGSDVLKVHTSNWRGADPETGDTWALDEGATYTRFGYYAARDHGGDHGRAAAELRRQGHGGDIDLAGLVAPVAGASEPDQPWPEPSALPDSLPPIPWPTGILPDWMQAQVKNVADQVGCVPDMPAMFGLGALSAASLGHIEVQARMGEVMPTGLYLIVAGPPGSGKSPALNMMMAPLRTVEERQIAAAAADVAAAASKRRVLEGKAKGLEHSAVTTGDHTKTLSAAEIRTELETTAQPSEGRLFTGDVTPERLATLMALNGERLAVVSDEAGVLHVDRYGDKTAGSKMDLYLQAFTGEPVQVDRQTAPSVRLTHPLLVVVAGAQPETWRARLADPEWRNRGLGARFMSILTMQLAADDDLDRDVWDAEVGDEYSRRLREMAERWGGWAFPARLVLDAEARALWSRWARANKARTMLGEDLEDEAGWCSKLRKTLIRVAALLHLADGTAVSDAVGGAVMARALKLGDYWVAHRTHERGDELDDARRLLGCLVRLAAGTEGGLVTGRTIGRRGPRGLRKVEQLAASLAVLEGRGWVRLQTSLPPAQRGDPLGNTRAMDGIKVHPRAAELIRDSARQRATRATVSDPPWVPSHTASDLSRVSRVSPIKADFESFLPISDPLEGGPPGPRATRATAPPDPNPDDWTTGTIFATPSETHPKRNHHGRGAPQ